MNQRLLLLFTAISLLLVSPVLAAIPPSVTRVEATKRTLKHRIVKFWGYTLGDQVVVKENGRPVVVQTFLWSTSECALGRGRKKCAVFTAPGSVQSFGALSVKVPAKHGLYSIEYLGKTVNVSVSNGVAKLVPAPSRQE